MKAFLAFVFLFASTGSLANPSWFDRPQATYTANHLKEDYRYFYQDVINQLGRNHALSRATYRAYFEADDIARKLQTNYPFDPLYNIERRYYRVTLEALKVEWRYARITNSRVVRAYNDIVFVSDKLHFVFNDTSRANWRGTCRVVLETLWGSDLSSYWGRGTSLNQNTAVQLARQDGLRQCEYNRANDNRLKCTVDTYNCSATRN